MSFLIIDDHSIMRQALAELVVESIPDAHVTQLGSLSELQSLLEAKAVVVDLLVLDLMLPESSGLQTLVACRSWLPAVPTVVISALDSAVVIPGIFSAGALAYFPKSDDPHVFQDAVNAALRGERYVPPRLRHLLNAHPEHNLRRQLNSRQLKILGMLAEGLPDKLVARQMEISEETVAYHLKTIFLALDVKTRAQAVDKGHKAGLLSFVGR